MEKFKSPKGNIRFPKEIKNIKITSKDNESFHFSKSPNLPKNNQKRESKPNPTKKESLPKGDFNPNYNFSDMETKAGEKQMISQTKIKTGNIRKETIVFNIPNKGKGRSLERVPLENLNNNNNKNPNANLNKRKDKFKNVMDIGRKNRNIPKRHNSVGKNNVNKNKNSNNIIDKMKQFKFNKNKKNKNNLNDYNNIDNLKNININEEKLNQDKNSYINYNIINNNINSAPNSEDENIPFKKFNSVCVSINNNYNYNVSLEKPPQGENYNNFINQAFIEQNINNSNKETAWKEKLLKINKEKKEMNYLDFKNLNKTESNFWKKKNDSISKKDEKNIINKSENDINKQKIYDTVEKNKNKPSENNNTKKAEPKKKAGILDFLRAFKDMMPPFNLRKKTSRNENENNSANVTTTNIKENLSNNDNYRNLEENKKLKNNFNTINTTKNEMNNNIKNKVYERRKVSVNSQNDEYNYNYYSDSAYDSCPIPNNPKNLNIYNSPNYFKNKNILEGQNNPQILSYSHKNILHRNYNNDNDNDDIQYKGISETSKNLSNKIAHKYSFNSTNEESNSNNFYKIFDINNNRIYKKSNNNNDYDKNIPPPLNDVNYNSAYIKKTKKRIFSPSHSSKSENINNEKYNINNNMNNNNLKEIRKFSFNSFNNVNTNNNINNNYNNINFNNINIGRESKNSVIDRQKIIESYDQEKYNSENINENLNINAEKKIQEIKININYKKNNDNNNIYNYGMSNPYNNQYFYSDKKLYGNMDDFIPVPKPKAEIESCIINFDKNKNKPRKIYENNLNIKTNTPINNNINNNYLINNYTNTPLAENNNYYCYKNIHDIRNNNFQNIYSKPSQKNNNINQNEKNIKRGNNLSFGELNLDINNKILNVPKPIKKKLLINTGEKKHKINRLADSQEFDNDLSSLNSDSSSQSTSKELNRTQVIQNSQIINSIYSKPFKSFKINNKSKNNFSANNSFQDIPRIDSNNNSKYNTDFGPNYYNYNDRELSMTNPGISKSNKNIIDKFPINNSMSIYLNKNNSLNNTDSDIELPKNYNNNNKQMVYTKKQNSSKINNKIMAINNITPLPSNEYYLMNDNKMNNIKMVIRPKVAQTKNNLIHKLYNYVIKSPQIDNKNNYFSKKSIYIQIFKMPYKQISLYTKFYYKMMKKPKLKNNNYIDKKRIKIKKGLNLPVSQICAFSKINLICDISKISNLIINEEIKKHFKGDRLYRLSQDFTELEPKNDENKLKEENNDNINDNEEKQINLDKELEDKIEIKELEKENNGNININDEIKKNSIKFSTPNLNLKENDEKDGFISPKFASKSENTHEKYNKNKIISIEIQLNNKEKNINNPNKNLSASYNNIPFNTNESLYIRKKPSINNSMNPNINNKFYSNTENEKCKTYIKPRKNTNDDININNFYDDTKLYSNNSSSKSNKIICIDIDLSKEQKKIQEKKDKEIRTYKRPTLPPLVDPGQILNNKINSIEINYAQNNKNDNIKQEIINKLENLSENNLPSIVDDFVDLLTKKIIRENINNEINYNKIRLSFMEILGNEYTFTEIIISKAINEANKIAIYGKLCNELCIRLTNEINFRGNDTDEDLKTILSEECKVRFEEIILDNKYNINDQNLLGIILFTCELINFRIISLDKGYFCFESLCKKYESFLSENGSLKKNFYLDIIIELLIRFGKNVYIEKNMKYLERIDNYVDNELNNLLNNDLRLPEFLRNKIMNVIKIKNNQWIY